MHELTALADKLPGPGERITEAIVPVVIALIVVAAIAIVVIKRRKK